MLSQSEDVELTEWAKNIKAYCHTYSKVMQVITLIIDYFLTFYYRDNQEKR